MPTYQITDSETGKVFKVTGTSPPSEMEAAQLFADYYKSSGGVVQGNPDASTKEINAMRRKFIQDEAANAPGALTKVAKLIQGASPIMSRYDVVGKLTDTVGGTEDVPEEYVRQAKGQGVVANAKEAVGNLPTSAAKAAYGVVSMPTQVAGAAEKGQLLDMAGGIASNIAGTVGLKGADAAADRWVGDPAGAAMDVATIIFLFIF